MAMEINLPFGFANCHFHFTENIGDKATSTALAFECADSDPDTVAQDLHELFLEHPLQGGGNLNTAWTYLGTSVTKGTVSGPPELGVFPAAVPGTAPGSAPPPNVSIIIRKRTGLAGRKYRGRMFMPAGWVAEGEINSGGGIDSGRITGYNIWLTEWFNDATISGYPMYLLHQHGTYVNRDGETVVVSPLAPTALSGLSTDPVVSTQRRRLR